MTSKDILFYSNYCEFSKNVLVLIQKRTCRDKFILVCVDHPSVKNQLPKEVDHVPLILTKTKHVVSGDDITKYIETFMAPSAPTTSSAPSQAPPDNGPAAFSLAGSQSFSDTFTFIGDSDSQSNSMTGYGGQSRVTGYGYIGTNDTAPVEVTPRVENEKKGKIDEAYEKYITDRDADITRIFGNQRPKP